MQPTPVRSVTQAPLPNDLAAFSLRTDVRPRKADNRYVKTVYLCLSKPVSAAGKAKCRRIILEGGGAMAKLLTGGVTHIVVGDVCPQTGLFPIRDVGDPIWAQTLSATFLHMGSILKLDGTIDVLDPRLRMPVLLTVDQLVAENEGQAWLKPPIMGVLQEPCARWDAIRGPLAPLHPPESLPAVIDSLSALPSSPALLQALTNVLAQFSLAHTGSGSVPTVAVSSMASSAPPVAAPGTIAVITAVAPTSTPAVTASSQSGAVLLSAASDSSALADLAREPTASNTGILSFTATASASTSPRASDPGSGSGATPAEPSSLVRPSAASTSKMPEPKAQASRKIDVTGSAQGVTSQAKRAKSTVPAKRKTTAAKSVVVAEGDAPSRETPPAPLFGIGTSTASAGRKPYSPRTPTARSGTNVGPANRSPSDIVGGPATPSKTPRSGLGGASTGRMGLATCSIPQRHRLGQRRSATRASDP